MNPYVSPFQDLAFVVQRPRSHPSRHELKCSVGTEVTELNGTLPEECSFYRAGDGL